MTFVSAKHGQLRRKITPSFYITEMFNQNINDLLSFSVFFLVNEFVRLEFDGEFKAWDYGFKQGTIQNHSTTVE